MTLVFRSSPSLARLYPKVLVARKPSLVRDGARVPLIEAEIPEVRIDPAHLRAYRELCGSAASHCLPIAYPHVLASGLHLAVLSAEQFPVKLLGLVHVRNVIRQQRGLIDDERGSLRVSIEGHVETDRGQEFTLRTAWRDPNDQILWDEECVFLARAKRRPAGEAAKTPGPAHRDEERAAAAASTPPGTRTTGFRAPAGLGRSYGLLGGDLNPIHLSDLSARLFGFRAAIAHGMWSMARCAADLDSAVQSTACELNVQFKLPVFLPSWLMLEQWQSGAETQFCLRDSEGQKPHLSGSLRPLS